MKTNARFIKSIITTASKETTAMPWTRGRKRAAFIAKRDVKAPEQKTA